MCRSCVGSVVATAGDKFVARALSISFYGMLTPINIHFNIIYAYEMYVAWQWLYFGYARINWRWKTAYTSADLRDKWYEPACAQPQKTINREVKSVENLLILLNNEAFQSRFRTIPDACVTRILSNVMILFNANSNEKQFRILFISIRSWFILIAR